MKKLFVISLLLLLSSCGISFKQIGEVNMISQRNVSMDKHYTLVKSYSGSYSKRAIKKEAKRIKSLSIDKALDYTVENVPGGEFLMNARIFIVNGKYFVVRGDVWGFSGKKAEHKGWKVGDKVEWITILGRRKGVIVSLKNDTEAVVKQTKDGKSKIVKYSKLRKN